MTNSENYRDAQRIDHMVKALEALTQNSKDVNRDMLYTEDNVTKLLMYDLIVLGEAANNISKTFAVAHPEVEWADIAGLQLRQPRLERLPRTHHPGRRLGALAPVAS